jgi:uncharacterized protein with PIN domain
MNLINRRKIEMIVSVFKNEMQDIHGVKYIHCLEEIPESIRRVMHDSPYLIITKRCKNSYCSQGKITFNKLFIEIPTDILNEGFGELEKYIANMCEKERSESYCAECHTRNVVQTIPQAHAFIQVSAKVFLRKDLRTPTCLKLYWNHIYECRRKYMNYVQPCRLRTHILS